MGAPSLFDSLALLRHFRFLLSGDSSLSGMKLNMRFPNPMPDLLDQSASGGSFSLPSSTVSSPTSSETSSPHEMLSLVLSTKLRIGGDGSVSGLEISVVSILVPSLHSFTMP